jgi:hypothetical protein
MPMFALLAISLSFAVAPAIALAPISRVIERAISVSRPAGTLDTIGILNAALLAACALLFFLLRGLIERRGATSDTTWGCGYAAPTAKMQYTGRSFSELLSRLMPRPLQLPKEQPSLSLTDVRGDRTAAPLFAGASSFSTDARDPLTRGVYEPFFSRWAARFSRMRWLQQGILHVYVAYIVVVLIVALGWMTFRSWSSP